MRDTLIWRLINQSINQLIDWLIKFVPFLRVVHRLIDWLNLFDWFFFNWKVNWLIDWFVRLVFLNWKVVRSIDWLICSIGFFSNGFFCSDLSEMRQNSCCLICWVFFFWWFDLWFFFLVNSQVVEWTFAKHKNLTKGKNYEFVFRLDFFVIISSPKKKELLAKKYHFSCP